MNSRTNNRFHQRHGLARTRRRSIGSRLMPSGRPSASARSTPASHDESPAMASLADSKRARGTTTSSTCSWPSSRIRSTRPSYNTSLAGKRGLAFDLEGQHFAQSFARSSGQLQRAAQADGGGQQQPARQVGGIAHQHARPAGRPACRATTVPEWSSRPGVRPPPGDAGGCRRLRPATTGDPADAASK